MAWEDDRSPITGVDLYAQHVTSSGSLAAGWPATGFPVSEALEDQGDIANGRPPFMGIVPDDAGGAVLVWSDTRNGGYDLYANRITSGGAVAPGWATDGIPLCTASFEQLYPVLCRDEFGGGYFVWFDRRNGTDYDIYASHLTSSGTLPPGWPVDGKVLCALAGDQLPGAVCEDGAGGAITAWEDFRRGDPDHGDIYATRVYFNQVTGGPPAGPRAAALAIVELRPNPSTGALSVTLRVASDRPARLEWLDVNGRRVLERELGSLTPGQHVVRVDETQGLPVGLYFVRLSQDDRWVMSRAVVAR
jgi:hypothetical protein